MSLEGELNITHVLRGKITSLGVINAPDKSLTVDGASADAKATGDALAKKADKATNGTVISENADYAEVGWWLDGNPDNEDRTGYFVCIADDVHGTGMRKAKSVDDVRGVVVTEPAFAGGATAEKFDENGQLLPKYDYVGIMGLVPVIDDGSCVVNERCMPNDEGIATASNNNLGYHVIERIDRRSILIAIEPNGDMVQRIKTEVEELQNGKADNATVEELCANVEGLQNGKVDKESGKALSTNDFTDAYKQKLDGIEAGANKFTIEDGAVTGSKIANGAVSQTFTGTLLASEWTKYTNTCGQSVAISGLLTTDTLIVDLDMTNVSNGKDMAAVTEAWGAIYKAKCSTNGYLFLEFALDGLPEIDIPVKVVAIRK